MQSDLEREMRRQLSLMQHKAVAPWPSFVTQFGFDNWCCQHTKRQHLVRLCRGCYEDDETPQWVQYHEFARGRMWRADFAYLAPYNLLIEVDGAVFTSGRHTRGKGWEEDARKQARAVELGYRTLRFSGGQVKSGEALALIERALEASRGTEGVREAVRPHLMVEGTA